jgi:hypothetical protein
MIKPPKSMRLTPESLPAGGFGTARRAVSVRCALAFLARLLKGCEGGSDDITEASSPWSYARKRFTLRATEQKVGVEVEARFDLPDLVSEEHPRQILNLVSSSVW